MEAILVKPGREAILRNPNFPRSEKSLDLVQNSCVKLYHFWRLDENSILKKLTDKNNQMAIFEADDHLDRGNFGHDGFAG
jgi:aspartate/methionine/tyrosine aminotransferase